MEIQEQINRASRNLAAMTQRYGYRDKRRLAALELLRILKQEKTERCHRKPNKLKRNHV